MTLKKGCNVAPLLHIHEECKFAPRIIGQRLVFFDEREGANELLARPVQLVERALREDGILTSETIDAFVILLRAMCGRKRKAGGAEEC